jgi:hypothetical protein
MTNMCLNRMKITGTISEITRFKQTCIVHENEQARLDFNAIDPMPDFSDNDALPYNDPRHKMGYDWRIEHWSTKSNAYDFHVTVDAPGCYEFHPAGPCLGEDGKNVPRSRIFPARR